MAIGLDWLILQNTDKYYMLWRRFLFVHELPRTLDEKAAVAVLRTNATSLVEHLVEFLSEWIVNRLEKLPRLGTMSCFFSTRKIIGLRPCGKTFTLQQH